MSTGYILAIVLVGVAVLVPTAGWIELLRGEAAPAMPELQAGVQLFRGLFFVTAAFVVAATRFRWTARSSDHATEWEEHPARRYAIVMGLVVAAAAALRLYRLGEGLWLDEVLTLVNYARLPFGAIASTYDTQNQHILYSLFAHLSLITFGESPWAFRLPAAVFGVASVYATYLFGRQITNAAEASFAALLLTFSFHHLWFSQNARGYTALLFFTLLSSHFLVRGIRRREPRDWLLYAVCVALGMYSHLTMIYVAAGQFGMFVWSRLRAAREPRPATWVPLVAGFGLSALLTLQLYAVVLPQVLGPGMSEQTDVALWINPLWTLTEAVARLQIGVVFGAAVFAGGIVLAVGVASYARQDPGLMALFIGPVVAGTTVTFALQHALWPRFFFFAAGFALLIVVRGIFSCSRAAAGWLSLDSDKGTALATLATGAAVVVSALGLPGAYGPKQDYVGAREFVTRMAEPEDTIATGGLAGHVYRNHYAPEWPVVENAQQLRSLRRGGAVWMVYTMPMQLDAKYPELAAEVHEHFEPVQQFPGTLGDGTIFVTRSKTDWSTEAAVTAAARSE